MFLRIILLSIFLLFSTNVEGKKILVDDEVVSEISFDLRKAMKLLLPSIATERIDLVENVLTTRASIYGFSKQDYPLILAMVMTESAFQNILGTSGEVGMLQVIPGEKHIRGIVARIKCDPKEKYCLSTGKPDIYQGMIISTIKVRQFLIAHPKYGLETGLGEMKFWKIRYERRLKKIFWQSYPEWYLSQKVVNYWEKKTELQKWWKQVHSMVGDLSWTAHYNWGARLVSSGVGAGYSMKVLRYYNKALGRKYNEKFSPMGAETSAE